MELVDMNSLGLFDYLGSYPFKSDLPYRLFVFIDIYKSIPVIYIILQITFILCICCRLTGKS